MTNAAAPPLRLVVFDATDMGRGRSHATSGRHGTARSSLGLSPIWYAGAFLHRLAGAADARLGAESWEEALVWAARTSRERGRSIGSLQVWGHGGWGFMQLGRTRLDGDALRADHPLAPSLDALRTCLDGEDALVWLRCCSAFGHTGRRFARDAAERLRCRFAGHTYIINFFQSGTHSIGPGEEPRWDSREGVRFRAGSPTGALASAPGAPNTISCLTFGLPEGI
jgi:hypothetical protein